MQNDYQPYSCSDLKAKFKTAKETLDNNFFPEELLNEFADYIDWVIQQGPQNTVYEEPELKKFFFEEFISGIAKRLRNIKQLPDQYLPIVSRLVLSLGELFGQEVDRDNSDMADAIRYLFEQNSPLHQNLFQSEESTVLRAFHDPQLAQRIPEEERIWRQSLTPGSKLDAVKTDREHNLKVWAKATVINVEGELIQVQYENDQSINSAYFWWYSPDLDRYNTKSIDDDWRLKLEVGDIIDSHDGAKVWYASTIIDKTVIQESDDVFYIKLLVGFRIFDESGEKQDDRGRRFIGWPSTFDEWINASSPRIQKYQSQAKSFEESAKNLHGIQLEETFEDQLDMLLYSKTPEKPVYGVIRQKCRSGLLVTLLNRLGAQGVFQKILDKINRDNYDQLSLETVFYYLDSITNCYLIFNKTFVNEYFPALFLAIKKKILTSSEVSLKNFKKERVDTLIQYLFNILMSRLLPYQMRENQKNMLTLDIGCYFLTLNFLEKRIDGAKMISEVCKSTTVMTFQASMEVKQNQSDKLSTDSYVKTVIDKLKQNKVLFQMFSKERAHQQLVERGEEVLKLMISQSAMTNEEMELVWSATKQDETTQLELYKLFNELASVLKINEINFIIDYLSQVPLVKILKEQVDLIYEIGKRARSGDQEYGHKAVQYMWRLAIPQVDSIDKVLVNKASIAITDIIKTWDNSHKITIFKRIIESLKNNQEGFLCIKMITKLLRDFQGQIMQKSVEPEIQRGDDDMQVDSINTTSKENQFENKSTFIYHIEESMELMLHFFLNFKHYMLKARQGLRIRQAIDNTASNDQKTYADSVLAERFCHSDQLNERIEFLKFISINSPVKISKLHLSILWDELVKYQMFQEDSDLFYKFIKDVCELYDSGIITVEIDNIIEFFQEYVFRNDGDESIYTRMTVEGFNSIYSFFLLLNQKNRKIIRLQPMNQESTVQQYPPAPKMTSYNNVTGGTYQNLSFNKIKDSDEDPGFQILVAPWELDGIETIWKIVIASSTNTLIQKVTQFLIKLYTNVAFNLNSRISEFEDSYITHCIQNILELKQAILNRQQPVKDTFEKVEKPIMAFSSITKSVTVRVQPPEESKILKYLTLLKELIFNSEKFGTRGVRSHNGIFKGTYLDCIQVTNSIKNGTRYETKFEFGVQSNTTLFELRKMLGKRVARIYNQDNSGNYIQEKPCHPYSVRVYRYSGCVSLPETDNGKNLRELKFKKNEIITIFKNSTFNSPRVSLMNPDKTDLSDQAKHLFKEWFCRFAEFSDPLDANSTLVLDRNAVKQFIAICTDTSEVSDNDETLQNLFENYDPNQDGWIEEEQFMEFWKKSVFDSERIVWQNILNFGHRYDLLPQALDGEDPEIYQQRKSLELMPRYKLAANSNNFNEIFSLVETMNPEVANSAWQLIKTISTNPNLYKKVLALDREADFTWDDIFDLQSINKMLYVLQIVEALIEEQSSIQEDQARKEPCDLTDEDFLKSDWFERFMILGGFQQIVKMFHKSLQILANKSADSMNKFEKNFIEQMLRLIKIFIISAYSSGDDEQEVMQVLELVRSKSKQDESGVATSTEKQEEEFKTPSKKVQGKFVSRLQEKRVQFSNNDIDQPEITTEFLFGDQDMTQNIQEETKANEPQGTQIKDEATKFDSQDESMKQFKALARIIHQSGLNTDILNKIDFADLQAQILELISLILSKNDLAEDDTLIIEHALSLWLATLIKNGKLINDFYSFNRPHIKQLFSIKNVEDFIITGLFTFKSIKVRNDFASTIKCISQKVKNPLGQQPVMFFLNMFKRNYPRQEYAFMWRECKSFFDTFIALIDECFNQTPAGQEPEIDIYDILRGAILKFKAHHSQETKGSVVEDKTLIGFLNMIERTIKIIQERGIDKERLEAVIVDTQVLEELFYEHLFFNPNSLVQNDNKSKSKESRVAAYSLLSKFMEVLEPHLLAEFLEEKVWNLIKDMKRPKDWKFVPQDNQKSVLSTSQNYVGIVNLGCICYMNSMMQQFFMVPQFRYQLLRAIDNSPTDLKEYKGFMINDNLLLQLQLMFANLELSERQAFYPLGFCFAFKDFDGNPTNTAIQQDAQEFLGIFFARLEELLKPTSQKHLLDNIFGGKVCSQLKCPECGNIRNRLETFYTLSVAVRDRTGLMDSLQKMIESSIINDFKCENCQKKVDVEKRQLIAEPPNVLIVHLQRIQFNFDTFQNEKINSHFDFPNVLDLKNYSFKKIMNEEGHAAELLEHEDVKHLNDIKDDEYIYKLVGVTIHRGTAEHGHYYSLINTKRGKDEVDETKQEWFQTEKDPWKVFDDENVKYFNFSDLRQEAFGGANGYGNGIQDNDLSAYYQSSGTANSYGQSAYMLVYEKMKKKPVKEVYVPEKKEQEAEVDQDSNQSASGPSSGDNNVQIDEDRKEGKASLEGIDTANSRVNVSSLIEQQLMQAHLDSYQTDPANGEKFKLIPYKKIDSYVPDWMKGQILQDNQMSLIDRHIYHEQFFNFIKGTLRHIANHSVMSQHQYHFTYLPNFQKLKRASFKIGQKVMFDMLSYYLYNTSMNDITSSLQTIMTFSDSPYTFSKGETSLLHEILKNSYIDDGCQHFLTVMFICTDKTSRVYAGMFTSILFNKIYQIYSDTLKKGDQISEGLQAIKQDADQILCQFIRALKSPECAKNWQKVDQFLLMIFNIVKENTIQQEVILQNFDIVPYLLDFLLANVNMKISQKLSTFDPIVALICQFTRYSLTPTMRLEYQQWVPHNQEGIKPPATLLGFDAATMTNIPERYPLKDESFDYILSSEFVELCLKEGVQCVELGKMIAHLCYKYEKFSKKISKLLLHGISRGDFEKVKSYLDVVTQLAIIKDQYQQSRLEWMFGVGILNSVTSQTSITNDPDEVLTKIGVSQLHSLSDEAYSFKSALIQDSIDDSLLHLLWRYKGRMDTYTVNCLYGLLNLISLDDYVAEFFSKLPSPTYCYARYTDWFMPYLEKQLADAKKGYSGSYSSQKEDIVVKCISLYDKYAMFINQAQHRPSEFKITKNVSTEGNVVEQEDVQMSIDYEDEEENIRNLISPVSLERGESEGVVTKVSPDFGPANGGQIFRADPQPYVITGCMNEKLISDNDYGNVQMQIFAMGCTYTESLPTGESNLAIPSGVFRRLNGIQSSKFQSGVPIQQEMQAQAIKNVFQSSSLASKVEDNMGRRGGILIDKNIDAWNENEEEHRTNDDYQQQRPIINDGDEQWEMVNNKDSDQASFNSNGYQEMNEVNVQEEIDRFVNENSNDQQDQIYRINVVEEGQDENMNAPSNQFDEVIQPIFMTNIENAQSREQNQTIEEEKMHHDQQAFGQEQAPIIWPYQVNYCEDLVYRVQVINYRDFSIKCTISFNQIQEICEYSPLNLVYPVGGFKCMVQPHSTKTMILLHKLRPTQDSETEMLEIQKVVTDFKFKDRYTNIQKNHQNSAIPPISLPLRNRNATAKVHPAQTKIGAATGEAAPLIRKPKVNKEIDDDEGFPENDYESDQSEKTNERITPTDPNYFDSDVAFVAGNPNQGAGGTGSQPTNNAGATDDQINKKQCPQCTLFNDLDNAFCEVCCFDFN